MTVRGAQDSGLPGNPMPGRLLTGTSGFAYRAWVPRFYPPGIRDEQFLASYAARLPACELNGTYHRWPTPAQASGWAASTPEGFRFTVKAQRAVSWRALHGAAGPALARLAAPLPAFGDRLGSLLFRVPEEVERNPAALAAVLGALPAGIPLTVELQHPSWHVDATFELLRRHRAVLCATEQEDDPEPPTIRVTGPFLYLRLRRHDYADPELAAWAARIQPFLAAGMDVFAFFRHDPLGRGPELALGLARAQAGLGG